MKYPWLDAPLQRLLAVHAEGRLPHALLIRGTEGWGEKILADRLALALLGRGEVETATALAHPDLKWIVPDGSMIKVDQIRELAAFAVGTCQTAPCKVAVLESAELTNESAANALLKTLEEPPPDTYLLLTSARPARLLATVRSRTQTVAIPEDTEAARRWLADQWPDADLQEKWFECGRAPLSVHEALLAEEPPLAPVLRRLAGPGPVTGEVAALLNWDVDRLTAAWFRHCVALLSGRGRVPGVSHHPGRPLAAFADELLSVRRQLLTTNSANQRLLYERLAARWREAVGAH